MGRKRGCTECYRLWQQYAAALARHAADEGALKLAQANGDAAVIADCVSKLQVSTRALNDARDEMARHVAEHDRSK